MLDLLADLLHDRLAAAGVEALMRIQDTFENSPVQVSFGTACSGTDLIVGVLRALSRKWKKARS